MSSNQTFGDPSHVPGQQGNAAGHLRASAVPCGSGCWNCSSGSLVLQYFQYVEMVECIGHIEQRILALTNQHRDETNVLVRNHQVEVGEINRRLTEEVELTSQYEQKLVVTQHDLEQTAKKARENKDLITRDVQVIFAQYQELHQSYQALEGSVASLQSALALAESRVTQSNKDCELLSKENRSMRTHVATLTQQNGSIWS